MSARRKARYVSEATTLELWVQGPTPITALRGALFLPELFRPGATPTSSSDNTPLDKKALRKSLRAKRRALTRGQQRDAALGLGRQFKQLAALSRIHSVAVYFANDGELDPTGLIHWCWASGKQVLLPVLHPVRKRELLFLPYEPGTPLARNRLGIPEPVSSHHPPRPLWTLDLVLTPLVGFDENCHRMGMGGGFYDRTLAPAFRGKTPRRPLLIGLAHEGQKVDILPTDPWDIPLDAVLTDKAVYWSQSQRNQHHIQPIVAAQA